MFIVIKKIYIIYLTPKIIIILWQIVKDKKSACFFFCFKIQNCFKWLIISVVPVPDYYHYFLEDS